MKAFTRLIVLGGAVLVPQLSALDPTESVPFDDPPTLAVPGKWALLGERTVSDALDHDTITVTARAAIFAG